MNVDALNIVANIAGTAAFSAALIAVVAMPGHPGGFMRSGVKMLVGGAMAIYLFVGSSHILQFAGITNAFDIYENYLKVLFIPLLASAAYALRVNEQLRITQRQSRILSAEHDMLMRVVDTTPTGIVVLDQTGRIEFSNDKAKTVLGLVEDAETGVMRNPTWVLGCDPSGKPGVMSCCIREDAFRDESCTVSWPDGRTLGLMLNATPIIAADGSSVGAVVAFIAEEATAVSA